MSCYTIDDYERGSIKHYDVGIIGIWQGLNYGSVATYYALYSIISNMGFSVLMIDRPRPDMKGMDNHAFRFARDHYDYYVPHALDEMQILNNVCDSFVLGSDQIWNYCISKTYNDFFYLGFVQYPNKKVAYAASFGHDTDFAPGSVRPQIAEYLSDYDGISVREESGVSILKNEYGINGKWVLDPVYLPERKLYDDLIDSYTFEAKTSLKNNESYILSYILDPTEEKRQMLLSVSEKMGGLRIINLLDGNHSFEYNQKKVNLPDCIPDLQPEEWLHYIRNARLVITDSFHGACFSIIFHKEFYAIINETRGVSRFKSLCRNFGIENRVVNNPLEIMCKFDELTPIQYDEIDEVINKQKRVCIEWLSDCLKGEKKSKDELRIKNVIGSPNNGDAEYERIKTWKDKDVIIFGAGNWGNDAYRTLTKNGFHLKGFSDNNSSIWGKEHLGVNVYPPNDLDKIFPGVVIMIAMSAHREEVRAQLIESGIDDSRIVDYSFDLEIRLHKEKEKKYSELKPFEMPAPSDDYCMGCGACVASCEFDAIKLLPDEFGYYKPVRDKEKCVNCGKCERVCPAKSEIKKVNDCKPKLYSFYASNQDVIINSSSGGVFPLLAEGILKEGGIVYGATWAKDAADANKNPLWNNEWYVVHAGVENIDSLNILFKSKYMQSYTGEIFRSVREELNKGRKVLFSGCPCQIAGLYTFLGKEFDNLYTIDLLCGNAPSAGFFQKYLLEKFGENVSGYTFRYKEEKWNCTTVKVSLDDKSEMILHGTADDDYQRVFHDHTMCSVHCEHCKYQSIPRWGDITIGDFWGIEKHDGKKCNPIGTSAILINNNKGKKLLDELSTDSIGMLSEVPLEWLGGNGYALPGKHNYCSPYRENFYKAIRSLPFSEAVDYALYNIE